MADNLQFVRDLFKKADVSLSQSDVWEVQKNPVVKHKALERLGAALKIRFQQPQILRAERDEAVILSTGVLGDVTEWSIGEACVNVNYLVSGKMSAYVYAMAEKRSRDRVILKLAGLHGVYSEEEADEFKSNGEAQAAPAEERESTASVAARKYVDMAIPIISRTKTAAYLEKWWQDETDTRRNLLSNFPDHYERLKQAVGFKGNDLKAKENEHAAI